jgi:hypothetical protein
VNVGVFARKATGVVSAWHSDASFLPQTMIRHAANGMPADWVPDSN